MKKLMFTVSAISFLMLSVLLAIFIIFESSISYTLTITFGTIFYHFAMRLITGYTVNSILKNRVNYHLFWFNVKPFEQKLYKLIRVKKWKKFIPTFAPETFEFERNDIEKIIQVTCQSEIVHEIIMILSLLPIMFSVFFGEFAVFLITSIISFLIDSVFVILQRYNRPRLMKLIKNA